MKNKPDVTPIFVEGIMKKAIIFLLVTACARGAYVMSHSLSHHVKPMGDVPIIDVPRSFINPPTIPSFPGKQVPV